MSWTNDDALVARTPLAALSSLAAAVALAIAHFLAPAAAASEVSAFEEPYAAPPLKEAMDVPMIDIALTLPLEEPEAPAPAKAEVLIETGIASTYGVGDGFQGNRTACGKLFNTHVVQVAHKTLKCGTMVRIEDAVTGKSVVAEVTDRGPYIRGRIVDLSWAAFQQLDARGGLRPVNLYLVG